MSRYIEVDDVANAIYHHFPSIRTMADAKGIIEEAPSIDIVRCKECKWADWYKTADGEQFCYCMETGNGGRTADDFCSYGERSSE